MGFEGVLSSQSNPTKYIGTGINRFEMGRVDASTNSAEMVNLKTSRDRANQKLVNKTMGQDLFSRAISYIAYVESAIAVPNQSPQPQPTRISLVDLGPKPPFGYVIMVMHRVLLSLGVTQRGVTSAAAAPIITNGKDGCYD